MSERFWINGLAVEAPYWPERAARYGDGLFESMALVQGQVPFLKMHLERITADAAYLGIVCPESFKFSKLGHFLQEEEVHLLGEGILNLYLWRSSGGRYLPESDEGIWMLRFSPASGLFFSEQRDGLNLGIYREELKAKSRLSQIKSCNSILYVLASRYAREKAFDDVLLMNTQGNIIESSRSNLFLLSGNRLKTAPLSDGCLNGVMRRWIMREAEKSGLVVEEQSLTESDLKEASEIWLSNAVGGIQWVGHFNQQKYGNSKAQELQKQLREFVQGG